MNRLGGGILPGEDCVSWLCLCERVDEGMFTKSSGVTDACVGLVWSVPLVC